MSKLRVFGIQNICCRHLISSQSEQVISNLPNNRQEFDIQLQTEYEGI